MGVKVYHNNQWQEFSSGSATAASIIIQDEGVQLPGVAAALNFTGDGVTASGSGTTKEINVNGKFTGLSDTPANYTGAANKLVAVNTGANGNGTALEFIDATDPGVGVDNYVNGVSFSSGTLTLERTGTLADLTTTIDLDQIGNRTFLKLSDTPSDYVGHAHKFVRVNKDGSTSNGTALEFITQIPGTAVGAVGDDKQVQFNDKSSGSSVLTGADGLEFHKDTNNPDLILKPASTQQTGIYGGNIIVESTIDTGTSPWNSAAITADGGLELNRRRISSPRGGPYIDFKAQIGVDFDARIQMDYDNGNVDDGAIDTSGDDYSALTFATGGYSYYDASSNQNGRTTEKIRIGKSGEIGILAGVQIPSTAPGPYNNIPPGQAGSNNPIVLNTRTDAQRYGNAGQVLTSAGKGNSVYWGNSTTSSTFSNALLVDITNPSPAPAAAQGSTVNLAEFRSIAPNSVELLIYNARVKYPAGGGVGTGWEGVATRIGRQIDVTNHAHIQFGANDGSGEQNIHLHTNQQGDIQLQDAKRILLHANKVDFAKLGAITEGGYVGTDYAGMTIVANSGNVFGTTTIDTGISVNQGHGGGVGLLFSGRHDDWGTSNVDSRIDRIKFAVGSGPSNRNSVPSQSTIIGGNVPISVGKSTQSTLTITMSLPSGHGGRWALMMMGGNCVDAFTVDV